MIGNIEREREEPNPTIRPLHNFTLPSRLKWGHQKHLRCMKLSNSPADHPHRSSESEGSPLGHRRCPIAPSAGENDRSKERQQISPIRAAVADDDIEAVRQKLMTDLRAAANRMKQTILEHTGKRESADVINNGDKKLPEEDSNSAARPWTLRSRRAGDGTGKVNLPQPRKTKFSIALSREEIEADFTAITGAKPPRKPKKRPRALQKEIDDLFPGFWLMEITPDKYKVPENADQGRGERSRCCRGDKLNFIEEKE